MPRRSIGSPRCRRRWRSFFFFQAEDGIRDLTVTGVQTCALPIFGAALVLSPFFQMDPVKFARALRAVKRPTPRRYSMLRSEERRVGKECRSRWSTYP